MRRRAGFTVAQLAERLSVTRATIYFWEQRRYLPNAEPFAYRKNGNIEL